MMHKYTVYAKVTVGVTYTIALRGTRCPRRRPDRPLLGLGGAALVYDTVEWNIDDCYPEPTDIEVAKEAADR